MNKFYLLFLLFSLTLIMGACKKQEVIVPSYVSVPAYGLSIKPAEGTSSQYITDVWVYVNDQTIGAYQIPAKFPVLADGPQVFKMRAGILLNGIEDQRVSYPFFDWYTDTVHVVKGQITAIQPTFNYIPGTKMSIIEGFEVDSILFSRTTKSDTTFNIVTGAEAFEGAKSAMIELTADKVLCEMKSNGSFPIPADRIAFLEINCKANYPFSVGIFGNDAVSSIQAQVLTIYPTMGFDQEWKKIYVNLSSVLAQFSAATNFNVYIGALRTNDATINPKIYIDNIKLVGI